MSHLHQIFSLFREKRISIKPIKAFISYPNIHLLGQLVNSLGLTTTEEKLSAITKLEFPEILRDLERYLGMVI